MTIPDWMETLWTTYIIYLVIFLVCIVIVVAIVMAVSAYRKAFLPPSSDNNTPHAD